MKTKAINVISDKLLAGRNLTPLKDHKGVVLKLTAKDKKEIAQLKSAIAQLECDLYKTCEAQKANTNQCMDNYFWGKILKYEAHITDLVNAIKEIKINRYNIQKSKLNQ